MTTKIKLFAFAFALTLFASCDSNYDLTGTWARMGTKGHGSISFIETYANDGRWHGLSVINAGSLGSKIESNGKYEIVGDSLFIYQERVSVESINKSSAPSVFPAGTLRRKIIKADDKTFIYIQNGKEIKMTRTETIDN